MFTGKLTRAPEPQPSARWEPTSSMTTSAGGSQSRSDGESSRYCPKREASLNFRQAGQRQLAAGDPGSNFAGTGNRGGRAAHQHSLSPPSMPQRNCAPHCGHTLVVAAVAGAVLMACRPCRSAGRQRATRSSAGDSWYNRRRSRHAGAARCARTATAAGPAPATSVRSLACNSA